MIPRDRCALVLVDYQARLMPAIDGAAAVIRQALFLGRVARTLGIPVVGTEQNPQGLGPNVEEVRALCEVTVAKMHFDACVDGLPAVLRRGGREVRHVAIAGCEAHVCLMQTALGLLETGFEVCVVPQACGSRRPEDKAAAMQRLAARGAALATPEMLAFEWLGASTDPRFREVLALVKDRPAE